MPGLVSIKLANRLACLGLQANYGVLHPDELESGNDVRAVEDQESLTFRYARVDETGTVRAITAQMRAGRVITEVWDDGAIDEWRVGTVITGRGEQNITVTCVPLWLDLVERADSTGGKGWVSDVSGGTRNFDFEITQQTAAQIWATYIIPNCPTWVTAGTIDPTYVIPSLSVSRMTPGALALAVRDALRAVDVPCEVRLRPNGTTDYKLDLVTQIGSSANTPVFHPGNALLTLQQKTDPTLQATRVLVKGANAPDGLPGQWGIARWKVVSVVGTVVTLADRNGGASPIAFDNQFVTNYLLRVKTGRTFAITASASATGSVTCSGGVSTLAADEDVEFRLTEPGTNTRTTTTRYAVSAVPDGTHITMAVSVPITANDQYVDWYAKVWSAAAAGTVIATTRIAASVAATDVITVASSAGVTNTHYVEFIQLDGAGEIPCYVDHPTYSAADPVGYGIKVMELSRQAIGVTQLCPNGWMRTWTNGANPPDGWAMTTVNGSATARNASAAFTRYGGYSYQFTANVGTIQDNVFTSPPVYPNWDSGHVRISARCYVYFSSYLEGSGGATYSDFRVFALTAAGGLGTLLGTATAMPAGSTATIPNIVQLATGTWTEFDIKGITLGPSTAPYGVVGVFRPRADGTVFQPSIIGYLDAIEFYPFAECPSEAFEFGDATTLAQSGNSTLRDVASPPLYYSFGVLDLERAFPSEYARLKPTLGANVRAADVEYDIDATVRLLKMSRNLLTADTQFTLANRPTLFTNIASASAATQQRVIAAVNAGASAGTASGPAFVALASATTLTLGAEISTPSAGAPIITLPSAPPPAAGQDPTGAAVTFVPANPATTPSTGVTAGTPPSRRKPITPF